MVVYNKLTPLNKPTAVALGFFDGVHIAHRSVIGRAVECKSLAPAVITFSDNPITVLKGIDVPKLTSVEDKIRILETMGVQYVYVIDFKTIMNMEPKDFVKNVLIDTLKANKIFCGFNYHFGKGGSADSHTLEALCKPYNVTAVACPPVLYNNQPVSSTRIRSCLLNGNLQDAEAMLGRPFTFTLPVEAGNHLGTRLSTPTFNQPFTNGLIIPKYGVYATQVRIGNDCVCGVTNIGVKPTVGSDYPLAETWLPQYSPGELYGNTIAVTLLKYLRPEKKFDSLGQLKTAIKQDGNTAIQIFNSTTM